VKTSPLGTLLVSYRSGYWGGEQGTNDEDVRVIRNGDIDAHGNIRWTQLPTRSLSSSEVAKSRIEKDDILLTTSGDCGYVAIVNAEPSGITCSTNFVRNLRCDRSLVAPRYLYHWLNRPTYRASLRPYIRGTTLKNLAVSSALSESLVPLPPLPEQKRIAAILDQAEALRANRRAALSQLDALAKSIFRDSLFSLSPANYDTLANVADLKRGPFGGALKKDSFVAAGYKVYEQGNAIKNDFTVGRYFISETKFQKMVTFAIQADDLIVSCSGSLGRVALVPNGAVPGIINQALLRIRPNQRRILPMYMRYALESDEAQRELSGMSHGTGLQNFPPMTAVKALAIPVPEINIQKSVCSRIATVEQLRESFERSQVYFDDLFASLQHRAFRGEL